MQFCWNNFTGVLDLPRSRPIKFYGKCNHTLTQFSNDWGFNRIVQFWQNCICSKTIHHILPLCALFLYSSSAVLFFTHKYGEIFSLKLCFQFLEFWELKLESLIACWFYDKIFFQRSHVLFLLCSKHRYFFKIQHYLLLLLM